MLEEPTLRLNHGDTTLFQSLGDPHKRHACLVLYSGDDIGRRFQLDADTLLIGRAPECAVQLDNQSVSRSQAELQVAGDTVTLRDLGSANGTRVNDVRLKAPQVLKDGDLVRMGHVVMRFYERQSLDALLHDHIYRLATVDAGTEVFSRKYTLDALDREIRLARRSGVPLSVVCLDLDHFKAVNDRFGHPGGDTVLRQAAAALQAALRSTDVLGRMGGEEFTALLPATDLAAALGLAERMRAAVSAERFELELPDAAAAGGPPAKVLHRQTVSLGVVQLGGDGQSGRELLAAADARLYEAKRGGRDRVAG